MALITYIAVWDQKTLTVIDLNISARCGYALGVFYEEMNIIMMPMSYRLNIVNHTHRPYRDDVIQWKHFPRYWPFVRGIHRSAVNSQHKGQWHGALIFSLICALNKRLRKQPLGWLFGASSRSFWRHCNACDKCCTDCDHWWNKGRSS